MLAARLQLPFSRRLAWPTFSVRIAEAEALADPIGIVRKVPPSPPPPPAAAHTLAARVACLATRPRRLAPVACGRYTDRTVPTMLTVLALLTVLIVLTRCAPSPRSAWPPCARRCCACGLPSYSISTRADRARSTKSCSTCAPARR